MTLIAFCVAVTLGVAWELFEFTMDRSFGLSMQKSGRPDTMGDLAADVVGAATGAGVGALYLSGRKIGLATHALEQFVRLNARLFSKRHRRRK